jgi:hypothetical protein
MITAMSALDELTQLIKNSKFISDKDKAAYEAKVKPAESKLEEIFPWMKEKK